MTLEEFKNIYTENPSSDDVMTEINRLYESEQKLTADFNQADSDRSRLQNELNDLNKRYRERFFSGSDPDKNTKPKFQNPFDKFFKEKEK